VLIGIICAMKSEARAFGRRRGHCLGAHDYVLKVCGPGREKAAGAANALIVDGCAALMSWGLAGGLDPALQSGDAIVSERVLTESGDLLLADAALCTEVLSRFTAAQARRGSLVTVARAMSSAREKSAIRTRLDGDAVDMESSAIAYVARSAGVPFIGVRCIVDPVGFNIPPAALAGLDEYGQVRPVQILESLWQDPRQLTALLELFSHYRVALASLRSLARALR
jgi:adenosylhomocysteine nucleosidase